jgi:hypothetical protein
MAKKIPSKKFSTAKKKLPSRKFPKSKTKIPSRKFAKGTAKIASRPFPKAPAKASKKPEAPALPDRPTDEAERQDRIKTLKEKLKSMKDSK